jgi:hypothetical protein
MNYYFIAGASPAQGHPVVKPKHHSKAVHVSKHEGGSKPAWLLALEIATGTMVGALFLIGMITAIQRCNNKSSIIIPWKKSASEKEQIAVYIGSISDCIFTTNISIAVLSILDIITLSMCRL